MLNMTPISLVADGPNSYRVRFDKEDGGQVEYSFLIKVDSKIQVLTDEEAFSMATLTDPIANELRKSIMAFHDARKRY